MYIECIVIPDPVMYYIEVKRVRSYNLLMQEAFEVLRVASQHDAFGRYSEASFLYMMSVDMLNTLAAGKKDWLQRV